jgi:hypothetical protein
MQNTPFFATLLVIAALVAGAGGCRSTKIIRKALDEQHKDTTGQQATGDSMKASVSPSSDLRADSITVIRQALSGLSANRINFKTFSGRAKVSYVGGNGDGADVTAYINILKDSMIWISIHAVLGIEGFRVLITHDSVKIMQRQGHVVLFRSVSYLQQEIHLPVDFASLQDLLIGNPVFLDTTNVQYYKKEQTGLSLIAMGNLFRNYLTLDPKDNTLRHSKLDNEDPMQALDCDLSYGDYQQKGGNLFSTYRKISVVTKSNLEIEMNFKEFKFNEDLSFAFSIPKNYKRK